MEKYLIILVLLASIYYIQNKLKDTEGFADAPTQSLGGVDDSNAINTLAQIARQLMDKGLKVPGDMNITGNTNITGNMSLTGTDTAAISTPNGNTKINGRGIMFGASNNGYELNSAQITAGLHVPDSLCIVGMGKTSGERKIDMWAEKGATIYGGLTVNGRNILAELDQCIKNDSNISIKAVGQRNNDPNMNFRDGILVAMDGRSGMMAGTPHAGLQVNLKINKW